MFNCYVIVYAEEEAIEKHTSCTLVAVRRPDRSSLS